jgi:hypothetical protein
MSGGHFDYAQYRINDMVCAIEGIIANNNLEIAEEDKPKDEWGYDEQRYYEYPPHIIEEFKNAIKHLKMAQIYAQRVDWLVSGDDNEESFISRLDEDLENLKIWFMENY